MNILVAPSVLFVITAADKWTLADGSTHPTGFWGEEVAEPHRLFSEAGWEITIATPAGVAPTLDQADYDVVFYPGGHGPMEDLASDEVSGRLLTARLRSGRPLGLLCHGPAALFAARDDDGSWPFAGYRVTALTNLEERTNPASRKAKWLLEPRLNELGADYVKGRVPLAPFVAVDRNVYTGQNPASSVRLAKRLIADHGAGR